MIPLNFDARMKILDALGREVLLREAAQFQDHLFFSYKAERDGEHQIWIYSNGNVPRKVTLVTAIENRQNPLPVGLNQEFADSLSEADPLDPGFPRAGPYREYLVQLEAGKDYRFEVNSITFVPCLKFYNKNGQELLGSRTGDGVRLDCPYRPKVTGEYRVRVTSTEFGIGAYTFTFSRK